MEPFSEPTIASAADRLVAVLRAMRRVAVAFSGGVDSTVVAKGAYLALRDQAIAVTGVSDSLARGELEAARELARTIGIRHEVVATNEFGDDGYVRNDGTRCYHCKSNLYDTLAPLRAKLGFEVICSGANLDDLGDYRPGLRAAEERGIRHPLQEAGFGKSLTRAVAQWWGLPNWDRPATPCLSSRLAVGVEVTPERTKRVDEAERFLRGFGLVNLRVRHHEGDLARIEVGVESLARMVEPEIRAEIVRKFRELGFKFVSVDLEGFRSGGLNVLVPADLLAASAPRSH